MRYMFEMTLHRVELHVPYEVVVGIVLKRGSKRLESKSDAQVSKGQPVADFKDEKLMVADRVYKDKVKKTFQDRMANIIVQIKKEDKIKSVGILKVNLIDYIEATSNGVAKMGVVQKLKLEKCPDQNANIQFTVRSVLVSQGTTGSETMSMGSEAMSVDSGPESEFDFGDFDADKVKSSRPSLRGRRGQSAVGRASNLVVNLQQEQYQRHGDGRPPLKVPTFEANEGEKVHLPHIMKIPV